MKKLNHQHCTQKEKENNINTTKKKQRVKSPKLWIIVKHPSITNLSFWVRLLKTRFEINLDTRGETQVSPLRTKQGTNTAIILYAQSTSISEFTIVYITNKEDSPNPPKKHFKTRSQDFLSLMIKTAHAHRKRENIINILKCLIKDNLLLLFCLCIR